YLLIGNAPRDNTPFGSAASDSSVVEGELSLDRERLRDNTPFGSAASDSSVVEGVLSLDRERTQR
ncbi:MAG: hypothetical protein GY862_07795, partial [Gammaproteobacteria bacterium]|nr:hypothetical protein [Gammaproteobacteria bacterium]